MSYFPDCRTDEYYNQKYLNDADREFIAGADWMVEQIVNMLEDNNDVYPELERILVENVAVVKAGKEKVVSEAVQHWAEMERDMMITSMLDHYSKDEYNAIKERVDANENV